MPLGVFFFLRVFLAVQGPQLLQANIRDISISMKNVIVYYVVILVSAFADGFGWNGHPNYSLFQCLSMECVSVYLCFIWFLFQCFLVF